MHSILLNLWLSSVPLLMGLSLAFFVGLAYYWFQNKSETRRLIYGIQGFIRGLFLVGIILCFIPWKINLEESINLPSKVLLIVDDSQSMNQTTYADFTQKVFDDIKSISASQGELKVIGLNQTVNSIQDIQAQGQVSSWAKVQELIRKESKNYQLSQVFFMTDGQLREMEVPTHRGTSIYLIPFGKTVSTPKLGISIPTKTVFSVPGERIHIPISVWSTLSSNEKAPHILVFKDGKLHQTLKAAGDFWKEFQQLDLELISSDLAKHRIQIQLENDPSLVHGFIWNIQEFQAKVEAFALAPNPNLGVINRVAEDAKIKLHWNFGLVNTALPNSENYLFYGVLPKELPQGKSVWYVNIPVELKKEWPSFEEFSQVGLYFPSIWKKQTDIRTSLLSSNSALWKEQMAEVKSKGSYEILDSTLHEMFKISFLRQADDLFSIELNKAQINLNEDIIFEVSQLNPDLKHSQQLDVQFKITSANSRTQFKRSLSQTHQLINFRPIKPGKYHYQANITYQGKEMDFQGDFSVLDNNPEKWQGRNDANFQVLRHREGVKVLEATEIKNLHLDNKEVVQEVSIKEMSLWEWPYFGLLLLLLVGLEWIIRKSLNQI